MIKKLMPSIILLIILIVGVSYAYSQNFFAKDQTAPVESKLLTASLTDVQQVTIRSVASQPGSTANTASSEASGSLLASSSANHTVNLKKSDGKWTMVSPADYPVNTYRIEELLDTLQDVTIHDTVEEKPTDISKYGLHPDQPTITLVQSNGQTITINIGDPLPTKGYYYAELNQGPVVQITEQTVNDLSGDAFHFIDTTPIGWDDNQLSKLTWNSSLPKSEWTLVHEANRTDPSQDQWSLNGKSIVADQAGNITDAIKTIPTAALPVPAAQVKSYKQVLTLKVQLTHDDNSSIDTYKGWQQPGDTAHIWITDPADQWAYQISANSLNTVQSTVK